MVGMPSAGKTSFVVRLCSQLLMNEGTLMYRLSDGELPEMSLRFMILSLTRTIKGRWHI